MTHGLLLAGPPGVGKTTIARAVAQRLGQRAIDLDELIEARTGRSPAEIIEADGEARFRALEAEALESLRQAGTVVSLGGGALTDPKTRGLARLMGPVIRLDAPLELLKRRLTSSADERPILRERGLEDLLLGRKATYAAVDAVVDAAGDPDVVSQAVLDAARDLSVIHSPLLDQSSRVLVGRGLDAAVAGSVAHLAPTRPVLLVRDEGIPRDIRERLTAGLRAEHDVVVVDLPGGEAVKTWSTLGEVLERALTAGCGRQSVVMGMGGGAVCDLANLVAHLLGRGAPSVLVPTTLLAQVDASVGGKCAVNMAGLRNPLGAFNLPVEVVIDVDRLATLDPAEYRSGVAELIKTAVIGLPEVFERLEAGEDIGPELIAASVELKSRIVARDPIEKGERKTLNLGHTLGHALESAAHFQMRHGEAVAIGLAAAARASAARETDPLDPREAQRIVSLLARRGLPIEAPPALLEGARAFFAHDKKGDAHHIEWVRIERIGAVSTERRPLDEVAETLIEHGG